MVISISVRPMSMKDMEEVKLYMKMGESMWESLAGMTFMGKVSFMIRKAMFCMMDFGEEDKNGISDCLISLAFCSIEILSHFSNLLIINKIVRSKLLLISQAGFIFIKIKVYFFNTDNFMF